MTSLADKIAIELSAERARANEAEKALDCSRAEVIRLTKDLSELKEKHETQSHNIVWLNGEYGKLEQQCEAIRICFDGLLKLHALSLGGKNDSAEADEVRDTMDKPWYEMPDWAEELWTKLSAALNDLEDKIKDRNEIPS